MSRQDRPQRPFLQADDFCDYRNIENNDIEEKQPDLFSASIVLYDRACPMCRTEMERLKALDRNGRLILLDIHSVDFDEEAWGVTREAASRALHVFTVDNQWLIGMEAIRHVYQKVGLGWLLAPTGWPLVSPLAELAYRYIAPNRFVISRCLGLVRESASCSSEQGCQPPESK